MKFSSTKVDNYVSKFAIWFPNSPWYWLLCNVVPNLPTNFATSGAVRSCEINCNYAYTCPYRICHETWEITYQSQLCVNKHMSPKHYIKHWRPQKWNLENCQANKFQKDQLPSFSTFFKSVHLFLIFTLTKIFICTHSCSLLCYLKLLFMFWAVFLCFTEIGGGFHCCSFDKFRDTAPLSC